MIENCALLRRQAALRIKCAMDLLLTNVGRLMKVTDIPYLSYTWVLTQRRKESTCSVGTDGGSWDLVDIGLKTHAKGQSQPVQPAGPCLSLAHLFGIPEHSCMGNNVDNMCFPSWDELVAHQKSQVKDPYDTHELSF